MSDAQSLPALTPEGERAFSVIAEHGPSHLQKPLLAEILALRGLLLRHEKLLGVIVMQWWQGETCDTLNDLARSCAVTVDLHDGEPVVRLRATKGET